MGDSSRERLLKQFRELVSERIQKITEGVISLEGGASEEVGRSALRELHGLKGEARMMGFSEINTLVHEMEGLVRTAEPNGFALTGGSTDALLVAADAVLALAGASQTSGAPPEVQKLIDWLKQRATAEAQAHAAGPAPVVAPPAAPPRPQDAPAAAPALTPAAEALVRAVEAAEQKGKATPAARPGDGRAEGVRIGLQTLEVLTTAVTNLSQTARRRELASSSRLLLARELAQVARSAEDLGPAAAELITRLNRAKEMAAQLHREAKLLANEELRELTQISEEVQALRMLPLSVLFEPYPRVVRDLARELGKEVELHVHGEGTRADRSVVESLRDAVMHLVRNALDHGIERREDRVRAGKPPKGQLILRAAREGERILIRIEDDGVGLDPAALRKIAVRKGFIDEASAQALSDQAACELIFLPGFTSKEVATDISGRGVGLDVVRVRIQTLGGDLLLQSPAGQGTVFELRVPVSLTVAPLLFVAVEDARLCLTASHVLHALKIDPSQVHEVGGRPVLRINDEVLPFASVASILGMASERPPREGDLVLLVRGQGATAAIAVDRVLEERVQPILPLKGVLAGFGHLSGATTMADGALAMVLSAAHLVASARGAATARVSHAAPRPPEARRRRILVVDDSPLTKELIASLLEAVGYDVITAGDGVDAYERLGREPVDLLVTDLEMPRMDGLELTRRLKSHATLRSVPIVIITTRGSEADRRKGMEAGADGYIAKGDLARQDLVDVVRRLLG